MKYVGILFFVSLIANGVTIKGRLVQMGTKIPLDQTSIFALPSKVKAVTNKKGEFTINVPAGDVIWVINRAGYYKLEQSQAVTASSANEEKIFYLEKRRYTGFETTIFGRGQKRDDTTRSLKAEDIATIPGASGDPVKAVQNLPGVARAPGFSSNVIIQGSNPQDTKYLIDRHEVPQIFHFGGLTSVIFPEAIERVDYLNAGYGPEYGRALGGQINLWTRDPKIERTYGLAFVDVSKAGAMIEGPINEKSSYLLGVRQSYIGEVLRLLFKNNEAFDLTVAPTYADLTGIYTNKMDKKNDFRVVTVGSRDKLEFLLKEPARLDPGFRGAFENRVDFFRIIPQLDHYHSENTTSRWSLAFGRTWNKTILGDSYFFLKTWNVTARGELEKKMSENWQSFWGFDNTYGRARVELSLPFFFVQGGVANPFASGDTRRVDINGKENFSSLYWRNQVKMGKWTVLPNARADYFSTTEELLPVPRLATNYQWNKNLKLRWAGGVYYQPPRPQEISDVYGNPNLESPRAFHLTLGADKDFKDGGTRGFDISSSLFYRYFDKLIIQSSDFIDRNGKLEAERYNNKGQGRAYGFESLIRYSAKPLTGWLSYTFSKSERWNPQSAINLSQFDQTHNVNLVSGYELPRNWKISSRIRYVTGNPQTPVVSANFDADNDVYVPNRGPLFSERLEPFFQVDVRIDKKWIYKTWILSAYLDIQNLTNRENAETIQYSYDFSQKKNVSGLPVLPILGVKGEF